MGTPRENDMQLLINDETLAEELIARRRKIGADRLDEVWDGVYVMSPIANNEHQDLVTELAAIFRGIVDWRGLGRTLAGVNVSDNCNDWTQNYRVPDVAIFLKGSTAEDRESFYFGGPDFAVEVVSRGDRTLEKLGFYAAVGTRELLVIDRNPWRLSLYRLTARGELELAAVVEQHSVDAVVSSILPIRFRFAAEPARICVEDADGRSVRDIPITS